MKEFWRAIRIAFAALGAWIGYFAEGCNGLIYAFSALVIAEYLVGIAYAVKDKELTVSAVVKNVCRKALILFLTGIAYLVDLHVIGSMFQMAVMFFFIPNETVLLLNGIGHSGFKVPSQIKTMTEQLCHINDRQSY